MISDEIANQYKERYDIVILGDVIEHLKEPLSVMTKIKHFLVKDGLVLITVPALMQLWAPYDEWAGHKKRYNKENLTQLPKDSSYDIKKVKYFMFIPSIFLFYKRKLKSSAKEADESFKDELNIGTAINKVMNIIMFIEYGIGKILNYPFGSSLIAIGKK